MDDEREVRRVVEFLRKSELINLEMPISKVVDAAAELRAPAGQVFLWSQWVLVSPPCPQGSLIFTAMGDEAADAGSTAIGDQPGEEGGLPDTAP